jgi:hypothetical protein
VGGLLAGLDALVVATGLLFAMFLVSAVLRPLLVSVLSQAPFIGGWLASNVDSGLARFQSTIKAPANATIGILADALEWIAYSATAFSNGLLEFGSELVNASWRLVNVTLPHGLALGLLQAEALAGAARDYALGLVQSLAVSLGRDIQLARSEAVDLVAAARAEALAASGAVLNTAEAELVAVERTAAGLVTAAELTAKQDLGLAEQTLASLISQARADALAGVGAVEHDVQALARAASVALTDSTAILGGDIQAAEARAARAVSGLEAETQKSIEGILNSLPWQALAAAVGAGEEVLKSDVRTLVLAGAAEIRKTLGDVESVRARYGPQIQAALAELRSKP